MKKLIKKSGAANVQIAKFMPLDDAGLEEKITEIHTRIGVEP